MVIYTGPLPTNPVSFGVGIVMTILSSILGFGLGGGSGVTPQQLNQVRNEFARAVGEATRFAWKIGNALGALLIATEHFFVTVLHGLLDKVKELATRLGNLVGKVLVPMLNALHRIREILNHIYDRFIRPALIILQQVRKYLAILRLFHIHWADKLDGILVRIQGKIIGPYLWVLRTLNGYGNWINLIITAGGVIQKPVFLNSMWAYQGDMVNLWWVSQSTLARGGGAGSIPDAGTPRTAPQVTAELRTFADFGGGHYADVAARARLRAQAVIVGV